MGIHLQIKTLYRSLRHVASQLVSNIPSGKSAASKQPNLGVLQLYRSMYFYKSPPDMFAGRNKPYPLRT